jgi:hypothetical protein
MLLAPPAGHVRNEVDATKDGSGGVDGNVGSRRQVFFRESSFLKMLPALLELRAAAAPAGMDMSEQKAVNVCAVLGVLRLTVSASLPASERAINQSVLLASGAMDRLLPLAVGNSTWPTVAAAALAALGDFVGAHGDAQTVRPLISSFTWAWTWTHVDHTPPVG